MKVNIVPIGNSKGIRIPKTFLEQCRIKNEVLLEMDGENIVIKPLKKIARKGWDEHFKKMRDNKEDKMLIDDNMDIGMEGWEW